MATDLFILEIFVFSFSGRVRGKPSAIPLAGHLKAWTVCRSFFITLLGISLRRKERRRLVVWGADIINWNELEKSIRSESYGHFYYGLGSFKGRCGKWPQDALSGYWHAHFKTDKSSGATWANHHVSGRFSDEVGFGTEKGFGIYYWPTPTTCHFLFALVCLIQFCSLSSRCGLNCRSACLFA